MNCIIVEELSPEGKTLYESTGQFTYGENYVLQLEMYDGGIIAGVLVCGLDNVVEKHLGIRGIVISPAYKGINLAGVMTGTCIAHVRRMGYLKISFLHSHDAPQDELYYRRYSVHFKHIANFQKDGKECNIWQGDLTKLEWKGTTVEQYDYNNSQKYSEYWKQKEKDGPFYTEEKKASVKNSLSNEVITTEQFKKSELVSKYEAVKFKYETWLFWL